MKIVSISNNLSTYRHNLQKIDNGKNKDVISSSTLDKMPCYVDLVSFSGGKSLDLEQTIVQLDKYSTFPPDIREKALSEIKAGNPSNKTLIDIHKEKYAGLNQVETLKEAKALYPEFKDVFSDSEIDYMPNSFIDDVKNGRNEYFDSEIDLGLQLLQLYWGEGFSLSDLTQQFNGRNILGTMERLNIPRVDRGYGLYLKLSDKNYNARFSREMSERAKTVARNTMERKEGAYIPRGPLTEEHKRKISEGLLRYYSEHPERLADMSKRQQEFYENNPVEKAKFSQVLSRAWGYREADSIRKKLSKFMGVKSVEASELSDISSPTQKHLTEFWKRNAWAKEQFSKCMKKSWQTQKDLERLGMIHEPIFTGKLFPNELAKEISKFAVERMPDIRDYLSFVVIDPRDAQFLDCDFVQQFLIRNDKAVDITSEYFDETGKQDLYSDVVSMTIDIVMNDLLKDSKRLSPQTKAVFNTLHSMWKEQIANRAYKRETINSSEIIDVYLSMVDTSVMSGAKEIGDKFNAAMEEAYKLVKNNDVAAMSKRTRALYDDYRFSLKFNPMN